MTSRIRNLTEAEKGLVTKFSSEVNPEKKPLTDKLEEMGFRVIYKAGEEERLSVLIPADQVLDWDMDPRSLDNMGDSISAPDLEAASCYIGLVAEAYFKKQGMLPQDF